MMFYRKIVPFILSILLLSQIGFVCAESANAPDVMVKQLANQVLNVLRQDQDLKKGNTQHAVAQIEKLVLPHSDLNRMTRLAVGKHWRQASPSQRQQLVSAFYLMLVRTYSNALTKYSDQKIEFKPLREQPNENMVRVESEVIQSGQPPVSVDYMLVKDGESWKIFDVIIAGVSLITNYRSNFSETINQQGIDGLIVSLNQLNQQ